MPKTTKNFDITYGASAAFREWNGLENSSKGCGLVRKEELSQESSFDVCSPSISKHISKFTLVTFGQFSST